MFILKMLSTNKSIWLLTNIIWLTLLSEHVKGNQKDFFGQIANGAMMAIQQGAEIIGNGGVISKDHGFELPFAKVRSKTKVGAGEAMRQRQDSESSEEDRRKRSLEDNFVDDIIGEESLLPLQHTYFHHILKRSPCHSGTGGGTGGGGVPGGGDNIDIAERRRRAYDRLRKAAAAKKKKAKYSTKTKSKKRYIVNDDNPALTRRKRQSEQDDLNNGNSDFSQHAQQVVTKIRSIWENIVNSMNQMAQNIKQKFSNNNSNPPAAEEI